MIGNFEKFVLDEESLVEEDPDGKILTENEVKRLANIPLLTIFYLSLQREVSSTPVTALELAAYLGYDVKTVEGLLAYLEKRGIVSAFKKDIPAYTIVTDLKEITAKDLMEILGEFRQLLKETGTEPKPFEIDESNEKYRKIYSELASEILELFGKDSANQMPI